MQRLISSSPNLRYLILVGKSGRQVTCASLFSYRQTLQSLEFPARLHTLGICDYSPPESRHELLACAPTLRVLSLPGGYTYDVKAMLNLRSLCVDLGSRRDREEHLLSAIDKLPQLRALDIDYVSEACLDGLTATESVTQLEHLAVSHLELPAEAVNSKLGALMTQLKGGRSLRLANEGTQSWLTRYRGGLPDTWNWLKVFSANGGQLEWLDLGQFGWGEIPDAVLGQVLLGNEVSKISIYV